MKNLNILSGVAILAVAALAAQPVKASLSYDLNEPYANFGMPAGTIFGTVDLAQGTNDQIVNVTVTLNSPWTFVGSGAGYALSFDLSGGTNFATIGNVVFTPTANSSIEYAPPTLHADGTGDWQYAVDYTGTGSSGTPPSTLSFSVTANSGTLSPNDFVTNASGLLFASDISGPYGGSGTNIVTGDVAAVPETTTIIAGTLLLLPFGASMLRILRKSRKA